jgi:hypothetical protein
MAYVESGHVFLDRLAGLLGLAGQPIRRIVLDVPIDGPVVAYVERYVQRAEGDGLLAALAVEPVEVREGAPCRAVAVQTPVRGG